MYVFSLHLWSHTMWSPCVELWIWLVPMGNDCVEVLSFALFQLVMTGQSITDGPIPGRFRRPLWALINHRYNTCYSELWASHCNGWLLYSRELEASPALRWLNRQDGLLCHYTTCYTLGCYMLRATCYMLSTHLACNNNVACCNCCNPICCFTPRWLPDNGQQWSTMVALVLFASQRWSTLVNNGEQSKRGGYGDSREETDKVGVSDLHSLNSFHHLSSDNTGYVISYSLISSFHHLMRKWAVSS